MPDERARLRADEGDARLPRIRGGRQSREEADLILFNTCSIRENADSRFIAHLGEAKRLKGDQPGVVVGVGGCWAQSVKDEVFERFPFVDVAFGPGQIHKLAEFLTSDSLSAQGYFEFEDFAGHLPAQRDRPFQAWLQISQGCNCACSYCIVPSTRGREQSRPAPELLAEVRGLAADGVREVTLLGQNVNSYGRDLRGTSGASFAELLREIDAVDGDRPDPLHEPAPEGHEGGRDPPPMPNARRCASTSTCRCNRARAGSSRRCAAPTTASAISTASH